MRSSRAGAVDALLLVEVLLALLLFGLGVSLFLIPAASPDASPPWWIGILLAVLFFAVVFLETIRRRRAGNAALLEPAPDEDELDFDRSASDPDSGTR